MDKTSTPNLLPDFDSDYALYPLTPFDRLFERSTFVTGWLLEGKLDEQALGDAIRRVTEKWKMLAGRVASHEEGEAKTSWYLKIPLGPLPPTYATYRITTTISPNSLAFYNLKLPLQHGINNSLPYTLFLHADTPRHYKGWAEGGGVPLTCWHLTYFTEGYTCLGFARSHGVFDGVGAAQVVQAVVDELSGNGDDWIPLPLPSPGVVENPVQRALDEISATGEDGGVPSQSPLYSALGVVGALGMAAWHLRERYWKKAVPRCLVVPDEVVTSLVRGVRQRVMEERGRVGLGTEEVSTGDVLVAWLMKTIYSRGTNPHTTVHCSNLASFRSLLGSDKEIMEYPHNAWTPLPYPPYTVEDLNSLPLHELSRRLAEARHSFEKVHIATAYNTLQKHPMAMPVHESADEGFLVSNVSASRILEADWGMKTVCGYRYSLTPNALLLTNSAYISGRLPDGSHLIEITVSEERIELVREEAERLLGKV